MKVTWLALSPAWSRAISLAPSAVRAPVWVPDWWKLSASVISLPPERMTVWVSPFQSTSLPIRLPMARMGR